MCLGNGLEWNRKPLYESLISNFATPYRSRSAMLWYLRDKRTGVSCTLQMIWKHKLIHPIITQIYTLIHLSLDKMATISQTTFSNKFSWMKRFVLIRISPTSVPKGPIGNEWTLVQVLAWRRNRWQAITLTNADPVRRRTYAAPGEKVIYWKPISD